MSAPLWLQVATGLAVAFAVAIFALLFYVRQRDSRAEATGVEMHVSPYIRKFALLTPSEQRFYVRLYQAIGSELLICPKARLADALEVRGDALEWQAAWNRIAAKPVDFLLVAPDTYQPLLAITLDDGLGRATQQDDWLDRAMMAAGLPVLRIRARGDYDPTALRREVEQRLPALPR